MEMASEVLKDETRWKAFDQDIMQPNEAHDRSSRHGNSIAKGVMIGNERLASIYTHIV
jgi:hypothetical protein